ncbi:MAG: DUF5683 domain-containing protein [Rikenellaceae bacterium]
MPSRFMTRLIVLVLFTATLWSNPLLALGLKQDTTIHSNLKAIIDSTRNSRSDTTSIFVADSTAIMLNDSTTLIIGDSTYYALGDSTYYALGDSTETSLHNPIKIVEVVGGILPVIEERELDRNYFSKDSIKAREAEIRRPYSALAMERNPIFKDTLSVQQLTLYSIGLPGFGQLYNKQAYKIPILYSVAGGFAAYGIVSNNKYSEAKQLYNDVVGTSASDDLINTRRQTMDKYNSQRTAMFAGATLTYMYFLSDGIVNYKGDIHPTRKATILAALFPGAGQLYNEKYWKLPVVYGGFATFAYILSYNSRGYQRYKLAYDLLTDGDDSTVDEFGGYYSETQLQNTRNSFRRYRDLGIILVAGFYLLQIVDAHVDAYLARYDISNDLAMSVEPTIIGQSTNSILNRTTPTVTGYGMGLKIKF